MNNCRNCHHVNLKTNPAMAKQGFAACNLRPLWQFQAPTFCCSKWRAKA